METKPALYIDVDGVLFGIYGGYPQLRPNVVQFLHWCVQRFDCFWLTAWPKERLDMLFSCLMAPDLRSIPEVPLPRGEHGKADCIDYDRDFYWIEDGLVEEELAYLDEKGARGRYIFVWHEGAWELERVWRKLATFIGEQSSESLPWDEDILDTRLGAGRLHRTAEHSANNYYTARMMRDDENRIITLTEELQMRRNGLLESSGRTE